jgi:hypothetical protein
MIEIVAEFGKAGVVAAVLKRGRAAQLFLPEHVSVHVDHIDVG